ncbi:hypothetical protein AM499_04535 [Bacillus sp. FJAT-22090]|uniref:hypothetical protein n=1 Tax=Bacillus sp. FJAT-22090 TaxID=1581038 RepID=UPI0006AF06EA|nr:hypothetical protein [Bacillus sp. FJAT-22090]ALC85163.1 hypothetical protein AM499_04535 [Bacillus sp. FJAT-22090]
MFQFLSKELNDLYGEDKKKLRTNTILYGNLGEGRWHTQLQPPLSIESSYQYTMVVTYLIY